MRQPAVEIDHEIDRALRRAVDPVEKGLEPRPGGLGRAVDDEIGPQVLAVFERPDLRAFLDEEIERIVDRHVGDDVDLDLQFVDQLGEDVARQPVAVRVLLEVHEMIGGRHFQRMRDDPRAAVRRGPQADDLRPQRHRPVVFVMRQMMDGGSDRHGPCGASRGGSKDLSQSAAPHNCPRRRRRNLLVAAGSVTPPARVSDPALQGGRGSPANPQAASVSSMCGGAGASTSIGGFPLDERHDDLARQQLQGNVGALAVDRVAEDRPALRPRNGRAIDGSARSAARARARRSARRARRPSP